MTEPFTPEIVSAVLRHMNEDHADDSLQIVRALGGHPDAVSVQLATIDPAGAVFAVTVETGGVVRVQLPWSEQIVERPQFRHEFARMQREAAEA
ncbi:DUF2470 domain-containing protein [Kribbella italica]|uniref:Putative heme iron utilization protein n=1 Tax=Kribbella italica TaxID=1540520 RepID=A0A7W9MZD5_9ACTN|nr:DUF2470 domain-containing protein [Kribbella italica]MBB5841083.1 putative heme iron utilization protein [Kribbella italica]